SPQISALGQLKAACAQVNKDLGLLDAEKADAIIVAAKEIAANEHDDQFPIDVFQTGSGTSSNMNTNEVIANLALEHLGYAKGRYDVINPNDHVNKSQSTNDAYPSGFRLGLYAQVEALLA
ncbi:lyase family protein, partial [Actinotignum schaalii]|uniref:lyase family protein n=1 Tax=Actinotignum schaalii TaxID=59505 RepID=UPI0025508687